MDDTEEWTGAPWLKNFFVTAQDPGFLYLIENAGLYKIGRTKNRHKRVREAKTWLPDMNIIGVKPFWGFKEKERLMHVGFACSWYDREWFKPYDEGIEEVLVEGFSDFSDADINNNTVDFIYWFNGNGMTEFVMEQNKHRLSIKKFLKENTWIQGD